MSESTKKVLIIAVSIVIIVVAYFSFIPPSPFKKWKCEDGKTVQIVLPDQFLIKYSGKKIELSVEVQEKLKHSFGIEDILLQKAVESTQILDQKLRILIIMYNVRPCQEGSQSVFEKIQNYKLQADNLNRIQKRIADIAESGTKADESKVRELIKQLTQEADQASNKLQ